MVKTSHVDALMSNRKRILLMGVGYYAATIADSLVQNGFDVVGICSRDNTNKALRIPFYYSIKDWAKRTLLINGLYPHISTPHPIDRNETFSAQEIASDYSIPFISEEKLETDEMLDFLIKVRPDILLVAGFPRKIPSSVLSAMRIAAVNLHPSLLPKHRGGTPTRWVIKCGDRITGVSAHLVTNDFDAGDVLIQKMIEVEPFWTVGMLEEITAQVMMSMSIELIKGIECFLERTSPQDERDATYDPPMRLKDARIDWNLPTSQIKRLSLAYKPKSALTTNLCGKHIYVWEVKESAVTNYTGEAGMVVDLDSDGYPVVKTADSVLLIKKLLISGLIFEANQRVGAALLRPGLILS